MTLLTFIIFVTISALIGVAANKNSSQSAEAFFLSNKNLGKWALGISTSATANTGFVVIGAVGMGYTMGVSSLLYPIAWFLGDLMFWFYFAGKINKLGRKNSSITIASLVAKDGDKRLLFIINAILLSMLLVYASGQLGAAGKTLNSFFEIENDLGMLITLLIVLGYILWGGFNSSIWTDLFQGVMMILLTTFVLFWGVFELGGAHNTIQTLKIIDPSLLNILNGYSFLTLIPFVIGFAFAGFGFSMSQPQITSRVMAGRNIKELEGSKWIYIGLLHYNWFGMCLIGMLGRVFLPNLPDAEQALPELAKQNFNAIFIGLILAGMFSAILSSLDSILISSSTILSVDIMRDGKEKTVRRYRLSIVFLAAVSYIMALFLSESVFQISLFAATILASTIGAAVFITVTKMKTSQSALFKSMIVGLLVALSWRFIGLHVVISDALVGFIFALLTNYIANKARINS